jgi:hypothetical protein
MRRIQTGLTMLLAAATATALAGKNAPIEVHGRATSEARYCGGGVAATEKMLRAAERSTPLGNATFKANRGEQIDAEATPVSFTTDGSGNFKVRLSRGKWCLYSASRQPPPRPPPTEKDVSDLPPRTRKGDFIDPQCLEHEKVRCDLVIEVGERPLEANIQLFQRCPQQWNQPCWVGPMPP